MWKSKLYAIGTDHHFMQAASQFLTCKLDKIPFKFLGLVVGDNPRRTKFWTPILANLKARLSPWIGRLLSIGGRVTLINSVITTVPIYHISFFKIPKKVNIEIIKIQRNFLWQNALERKWVVWISWKTINKLKEDGGLGIKDILTFNKALLTNWLWRFVSEENTIWKAILEERYGILHERILFKVKKSNKNLKSVWWRDLMQIGDDLEDFGFLQMLSIKIGDENKTPFWHSRWIVAVTAVAAIAVVAMRNAVVAA
ncbi:uncharacterized mitochondrial protein AtMg00310-like [Vicia villosa]|uniref:uncharacterized mitochondrial protein AtMg00310-like n=1 Tax=Vicia villosa TaxID=3911 RepID=UPI00273AA7AC|nr:uncharacterized mitochondrial protein AtMg00310-like [Vicia villosa]